MCSEFHVITTILLLLFIFPQTQIQQMHYITIYICYMYKCYSILNLTCVSGHSDQKQPSGGGALRLNAIQEVWF